MVTGIVQRHHNVLSGYIDAASDLASIDANYCVPYVIFEWEHLL